MSNLKHTAFTPYVNRQDPSTWLRPGDKLMAGGFDWAWCYVIFGPVPEFPDYLASSAGDIWTSISRWREGLWVKRKPQYMFRRGKLSRTFLFLRNRESVTYKGFSIGQWVLITLFCKCPKGMECCHTNGDVNDNRLSNLRWDTHIGNECDKVKHGTKYKGEKHHLNILGNDDVLEVVRLFESGWKQQDIADRFGVSQGTIASICTGRNWSHLTGIVFIKNRRRRIHKNK